MMESHCNAVAARIVGAAKPFQLVCSGYKIYCVVVSFDIVVGSEIATSCAC